MELRRPRLTPTVCALALMVPMGVTACSGGDKTDPNDLKTINIMAPLLSSNAAAPDKNGEVQKAVETLGGKSFNITWVPNSNYNDRTNVVLASNDLPEIMVVQGKTSNFIRSAQAGAFWDLTSKLDKYPNLKAENKQVQLNASVDGKAYGVYRRRDPMRAAVMVRKDWLAKLGLSMPKTVDDLYNIAKAFTTQDPDGNGQKDTYGLIIPKWPSGYANASPYDVIQTWFGAPNGWGLRNGKLVPDFDTDEFMTANKFVKKMIDEGLVNPDFATLDSAKWNTPFLNGKGGIIVDVSSRSGDLLKLFKEKDPTGYGNYVDVTGNLANSDGKLYPYPTAGYSGFLAIPKQSVKTEAELDDVLKTLNKLSSKEGQILMNNGFEGKNFKVQDNYAVGINATDAAVKTITNDVTSFAQLGTNSAGYLAYQSLPAGTPERTLFEKRLAFQASDLKTAVNNPTLAIYSKTYTDKGAQLDQLIADARIKFLAGQLDEAGLKAEIKRWHSEGGDTVIKEMNDGYAKIKK